MPNQRLLCAKIVQKIAEEKIFFSELKKQVPTDDLPFCNMLCLTTLRYLTALQKILAAYLHKKIPHKHRLAEYLLLQALAELLLMQTAPYAIINETVQNIKKSCDRFLAGMANAVLRKADADKDKLRQQLQKADLLPESFKQILHGYTAEEIAAINNSIKQIPPLDITVKNNPQAWQNSFNAKLLPNGTLRLHNAAEVYKLPGYTEGNWWVQDVAAALPVQTLGNISKLKAIDLCSAPGGKTAQLAAQGADVTAVDISSSRLNILQQNMRRLGFTQICTIASDALDFLRNSNELFDIVLLDAPCSASGTFRRHPEILHIKTVEDVNKQAELQRQLLNECHHILKVGGILLYCVCSISKTEGEEQIAAFLHNNPHFVIEPIDLQSISSYGTWDNALLAANGTVRTLPFYAAAHNGMDSFFICKMKRII